MIFAGELNGPRLSLFYTGEVKYLKRRFSSVQLTLDDQIFTAQCKGD